MLRIVAREATETATLGGEGTIVHLAYYAKISFNNPMLCIRNEKCREKRMKVVLDSVQIAFLVLVKSKIIGSTALVPSRADYHL